MLEIRTEVAIVGAGPAGMMLAIELGCRGVDCVILDRQLHAPLYPKANASSSRTMEHYRRRGFAGRVRAAGLPADHPQDVAYFTRLNGIELSRFRAPSAAQAAAGGEHGDFGDSGWPSPELPHRAQQMYIEAILRDELVRYPSVRRYFGADVEALVEDADGVALSVAGRDGPLRIEARYVVGCDGARSMVRAAMGVEYGGVGAEQRAFFGGQMASIFVESEALAALLPPRKAWQYWFANPQRRGVMLAIDGAARFVFGVQLAPGQTVQDLDVDAVLTSLVGRPFNYALLNLNAWTAGHTLVATRFRRGRCFIAGDAAHLFTPTSGMGYNTSVDDAVNLGWKLAAVLQGWAGPQLLDSYEDERQPVALRNTSYARAMADSMAALAPPDDIEQAGAGPDQRRAEFGQRCRAHVAREFNTPGLQLGARYHSAVVAHEDSDAPPDDATIYRASGYPGARAPHVALDGGALFDRFGRDFTLLCLDGERQLERWCEAACVLGVPLTVLRLELPAARAIYGARLALIRPDGHIAWRGDDADDVHAVLRLATAQ